MRENRLGRDGRSAPARKLPLALRLVLAASGLASLCYDVACLRSGAIEIGRTARRFVAHRGTEPGMFLALVVLFALMGATALAAALRGDVGTRRPRR